MERGRLWLRNLLLPDAGGYLCGTKEHDSDGSNSSSCKGLSRADQPFGLFELDCVLKVDRKDGQNAKHSFSHILVVSVPDSAAFWCSTTNN